MAILLLLLSGLATTPSAARVDAERAVERARFAFVIGATRPFDELYPRAVFEKRVERQLAEEAVLKERFGLSPTPKSLAAEFDRIETATRAPEQWAAIKQALGNDRRVVEEVFCRPLLVARVLRARFAFDPGIHAAPHQDARDARTRLIAGGDVAGASVRLLRRRPAPPATTEELMQEAKGRAVVSRAMPATPRHVSRSAPSDVDPEVAAALRQQLRKPGDVTTILEERGHFEVYRLVSSTPEVWKVQAIAFPKVDFEGWFAKQPR